MKKNTKNFSGSVLVYSLLILSIMVMVMLGVAQVTMQNKKTGLSTKHSDSALQTADSGVEAFIDNYKTKASRDPASGLSGCSGDGTIIAGGSEIVLQDDSGNPINCNSAQIKDIKKVKSVGEDDQQNRAVQSEPPCAGVEFEVGNITSSPGDVGLVGYWPFNSSSQFNNLVAGGNNGVSQAVGSPPSPITFGTYPASGGKTAAKINSGADLTICAGTSSNSDPCRNVCPVSTTGNIKYNHNWIEIQHVDAFKTINPVSGKSEGTFSFWFYADTANAGSGSNYCTRKFSPFSKDANSCDSRGPVYCTVWPCTGSTYLDSSKCWYDLDIDGIKDSGESGCALPICNDFDAPAVGTKTHNSSSLCDCGHLSLSNNFVGGGSVRYQNDGNGGFYNPTPRTDFDNLTGAWYLITITYDSNAIIFYKNGVEMSRITTDLDGSLEGQIRNANDIWLGKFRGMGYPEQIASPYLMKGAIREVRIYNRPLSKCEVKRLFLDTQ